MKYRALNIIIFLLVLSLQLKAQYNLVPNSGFEDYNNCPYLPAQLDTFCKNWLTPLGASHLNSSPYTVNGKGNSDYFNKCDTGVFVGIAKNAFGYQNTVNGNAYAGISLTISRNSHSLNNYTYKEYIEVQTLSSLESDIDYCIEIDYSIAEHIVWDVVNVKKLNYYPVKIGFLLTDTIVKRYMQYGISQPLNICATPTFETSLVPFKDTVNWIHIQGNFKAKGGERYLTIGNFECNPTDYNPDSVAVYIYIDDVKLWKVEDTVQSDVNKYLKVYPIPTFTDKTITFEYVNGDLQGYDLLIYNSLGQRVFKYHFESSISKQRFPFMNLATGVYYYSLRHNDDKNFSGKLIILK